MPSKMSKKLLWNIGSPPVIVKALIPRRALGQAVIRLIHAPLTHKRRIVRRIEAVQTVVVAPTRYHPVQGREIPIGADHRSAPIGQYVPIFRYTDKIAFKKPFGKRTFSPRGKLGFAVARAKKFKFFYFLALSRFARPWCNRRKGRASHERKAIFGFNR